MSPLATSSRALHVMLLAAWLGIVLFGWHVEPLLTTGVGSQHFADALRDQLIEERDWFALWSSLLLWITLLVGWLPLGVSLQIRTCAVFTFAGCLWLRLKWLMPELASIRAAMGRPLDDLVATDSWVIQYQTWERYGAWLDWFQLALGLGLLMGAALSTKPKRRHGIEI